MSQVIDVATAVREIVSTKKRNAFFFIVGAGISAPAIPLASGIEAECRKIAERDGIALPEPSNDPMTSYERMLVRVHPNPRDRQDFLHDLMHDAPISPANLRLAHLLESALLTNLVITTNFDE